METKDCVGSSGAMHVVKRRCVCSHTRQYSHGNAPCSVVQTKLLRDDKRHGFVRVPLMPSKNKRGFEKRQETIKFVHARIRHHLHLGQDFEFGKDDFIARVHFPIEKLPDRKRCLSWFFNNKLGYNKADILKRRDGSVITVNVPDVPFAEIKALANPTEDGRQRVVRTKIVTEKRKDHAAMLEVLEQGSPTTFKIMKISRTVVQSQSKPQEKLQHMQKQIEQLEEEHAKTVKDLEDQIKALKRKVRHS